MLWFALHLPELPLEAWLATVDPPADGSSLPTVVVEARRVLRANAAARAAGIEPGQSAATAASLAAGLTVFPRDPAREAAFVDRLLLALARFTPALVRQADGVLLEVSSSLRLFGGTRSLWRAVGETVRQAGTRTLRMSAAPTATAAAVLARAEVRSPALARLPLTQRLDALPLERALTAWGLEERLYALLHGIGCRTLGDVRLLPRLGSQRRGLGALLDAIARAHGQAPDPQTWVELPQRFELGLELLHRADDAAMLVFASQRLVQPLAGWLAQQWRAATRLTLLLRHETSLRHQQADTDVVLALSEPTRDAAQIGLLLRERLQRLLLPAPVYALTLRLDAAVGHAGREAVLWREAGGHGGEEARELFDRLAARLGAESVCRPALVADHRPERAMRLQPLHEKPPAPTPAPPPGGPRPAWLLPQPQRLAEDPALGRPLLQGRPLELASRAERIEAGWFDGQPIRRDYHVACAPDHRWLWIYRERRGDDASTSHWYLHGVFG